MDNTTANIRMISGNIKARIFRIRNDASLSMHDMNILQYELLSILETIERIERS